MKPLLTRYAPMLRIVSGLVLFTFATLHFLNHALGLISLDAMNEFQHIRKLFNRSAVGTVILSAAALTHFVFGISRFLHQRTWTIRWRDKMQLAFGLLVPLLLLRHIIGTRGVYERYGYNDDYRYVLWALWPSEALNQAVLMTLVWVHGCIGLHNWLAMKPWYRRTLWLWYAAALFVPLAGFAGFVSAGRLLQLTTEFERPLTAEQYAQVRFDFAAAVWGYAILLAAIVAIWAGLLLHDRFRPKLSISYTGGSTVWAPAGMTLLDVSRANRIPHASVCGGRARCSTCRVRVVEGLAKLPRPQESELKVLKRVAAPANVRLACQLRPTASLVVTTLLPARFDLASVARADKYLWGIEQEVTILFCDMRGFTRLSAERLSYDVVFLLNQFLFRMSEAVEDSGGYVDKFMGDGIMAIFGMDMPAGEGAIKAIRAARAMGGVLDSLNQSLREELPAGLNIGIGIHTGQAILGRIGASQRDGAVNRITALGGTVNTASRLEGASKDLGVQLVISSTTVAAAGGGLAARLESRSIDIRGLSEPLEVFTLQRATDMPDIWPSP